MCARDLVATTALCATFGLLYGCGQPAGGEGGTGVEATGSSETATSSGGSGTTSAEAETSSAETDTSSAETETTSSGGCPQSGREVFLRTRDVLQNEGLAARVNMSFDIEGGDQCAFPANCLNFSLQVTLPVGRSVVGSYGVDPDATGQLVKENGEYDAEFCFSEEWADYEMEVTAYDEETGCYAGRMISVDNPLFEPIVGDFWGYTGCAG